MKKIIITAAASVIFLTDVAKTMSIDDTIISGDIRRSPSPSDSELSAESFFISDDDSTEISLYENLKARILTEKELGNIFTSCEDRINLIIIDALREQEKNPAAIKNISELCKKFISKVLSGSPEYISDDTLNSYIYSLLFLQKNNADYTAEQLSLPPLEKKSNYLTVTAHKCLFNKRGETDDIICTYWASFPFSFFSSFRELAAGSMKMYKILLNFYRTSSVASALPKIFVPSEQLASLIAEQYQNPDFLSNLAEFEKDPNKVLNILKTAFSCGVLVRKETANMLEKNYSSFKSEEEALPFLMTVSESLLPSVLYKLYPGTQKFPCET